MEYRATPTLLAVALAAAVALATAMPAKADVGNPNVDGEKVRDYILAVGGSADLGNSTVFHEVITTVITMSPEPEPKPEIHDWVATGDRDAWDEADARAWGQLLGAVEVLETGGPEAKRAVFPAFPWVRQPFHALTSPPPDDPTSDLDLLARLALAVASEEDSFLQYRIAHALAASSHPGVEPIIVALARHPAPSVRATAIMHVRNAEDHEVAVAILRKRWPHEHTDWVRAGMLRVLCGDDDSAAAAAAPDLVFHDHYELASAAINCVAGPNVSRYGELLARRVAHAPDAIGRNALRALNRPSPPLDDAVRGILEPVWNAGPEDWERPGLMRALDRAGSMRIVDEARALVHDVDPVVANIAVQMLGRHRRPGDLAVLSSLAANANLPIRVAALEALVEDVPTPTTEAIVLAAAEPWQPEEMRSAAVGSLTTWVTRGLFRKTRSDVPDPAARLAPVLRDIAATDPSDAVRSRATRTLEMLDGIFGPVLGGCGSHGWGAPGEVLFADDGRTSVRCHAAPRIEVNAPIRPRLAPGPAHVRRVERFDDGHEEWCLLRLHDEEPCWVPATFVRLEEPGEDDLPSLEYVTREIDIAIERTRTESFRALEDAGLVERFDEGDTRVGVRMRYDPEDEEAARRVTAVLRE